MRDGIMDIQIPISDIEFFFKCFFVGFFSWPAFWWLMSAIFNKACHDIDEATKSSLHYLQEDHKQERQHGNKTN